MDDPAFDSLDYIQCQFCQHCELHHNHYALKATRVNQAAMGMACPWMQPSRLARLPFDDERPAAGAATTAFSWLSTVVQNVTVRERFTEAFALYGVVFETLLASHWRLRDQTEPRLTLGPLVEASRDAGFIPDTAATALKEFVTLRNDLIHGRWRDWHAHSDRHRTQDVEGHLWAWFFHEQGYGRTTTALFQGRP